MLVIFHEIKKKMKRNGNNKENKNSTQKYFKIVLQFVELESGGVPYWLFPVFFLIKYSQTHDRWSPIYSFLPCNCIFPIVNE